MKFIVFSLIALIHSAWAEEENFYLAPPPRGFQGVEAIETTTSRRFDSETESDILTYNPINCHFQYALRMSPNFFCGTAGSLGSKRFLLDMDLMVTHSFHEKVDFRFHGVKKQDLADQTEGNVLELIYRLSDHLSWGLHGQLDSFKSEDDVGMSLNFSGPQFFSRLEMNAYDYSRNSRNELDDRFKVPAYSLDASALKVVRGRQYFLSAHFEPQWVWHSPAVGKQVSRARHVIEAFTFKDGTFLSLESSQGMTHINQSFEDEKRMMVHGERQLKNMKFGLRGVRKSWRTEFGQLVHNDLLPFVWSRLLANHPEFNFGYEVTWHQSQGESDLRSESDRASAFEHRLNVAYDVLTKESGYFRLLFTFDMDRFGSGETWEGGNGQIVFTF